MNILFIATPIFFHDFRWMKYFSHTEGFKVYLISEKASDHLLTDEIKTQLKNNNITLLPSLEAFSLIRPYKTIRSAIRLNKIIRENSIDAVHALFATPYAFWVNFVSKPSIITTRGSDALIVLPQLLNGKGIRGFHDFFLFKILRNSFKKAFAVTSTSQTQIDNLKKMFPFLNEVHLIRTGINFNEINAIKDDSKLPASLKNKKFIFSPRYFERVYNIELQIDAIKLLDKNLLKDYHFVFIKGKHINKKFGKKIENHLKEIPGLNYQVFDILSQEEMWYCFKHAKLTLITAKSDGTPNTALEAMAANCPLILGKFNYDTDLFSNTCLRLQKDEPDELAEKIVESLENYPAQLLENAYEVVEHSGNNVREMEKLKKIYFKIKAL